MSKFMFQGQAGGVHGTADIGPTIRRPTRTASRWAPARRRPAVRRRCDEMTTADKVKAILAGIVIGLMLAAPVAALVVAAGNSDPNFFHEISPWSFGGRR